MYLFFFGICIIAIFFLAISADYSKMNCEFLDAISILATAGFAFLGYHIQQEQKLEAEEKRRNNIRLKAILHLSEAIDAIENASDNVDWKEYTYSILERLNNINAEDVGFFCPCFLKRYVQAIFLIKRIGLDDEKRGGLIKELKKLKTEKKEHDPSY